MENLGEEFKEKLSLKEQQITGVLYDPKTLLHKSDKQHVECPARILSIVDRLREMKLLQHKNVQVIQQITPGKREHALLAHPQNYVEFLDNMWPESTQKSQIFIVDTYINKHSLEAAYISLGGVITGCDQIMKGDWKNAFAIVRPPGHHSGEKSTCTGFCFLNNVAIAAKYLQKTYGLKKILIVDWDVHHGDGTQHLLYDDPSILFWSFHRFDNGIFYPGENGSEKKVGEGAGKGFNLNIPWNINSSEKSINAGTHEYIYAFERIGMPVFEGFEPDFVLVSSGFDSARGDPLGQLNLWIDGYAYMTRRLSSLAGGRVLVALEGGYNLESIAWGGEGVLRGLLEEEFPIFNSEELKSFDQLKSEICPSFVGLNAVERCLTVFSDYWPILCTDKALMEYERQILQNVAEQRYIVSGHPSKIQFLIQQGKLKQSAQLPEIQFYQRIDLVSDQFFQENQIIKQFIPKFLGVEQNQDVAESQQESQEKINSTQEEEEEGEQQEQDKNQYDALILQDAITGCEKGSIIDFQLGKITVGPNEKKEKRETQTEKSKKTTSLQYGFRVSGAIIQNKLGAPVEIYDKNRIPSQIERVQQLIGQVFSSNQSSFNLEARDQFIGFLTELIDFWKQINTRSFINSSILCVVDNTKNTYNFKLIDFNYVEQLTEGDQEDQNVLFGLENLLGIIQSLDLPTKSLQQK